MKQRTAPGWFLAAAVIGMIFTSPIAAREAAFMEPASGAGANDEAVRAEPKGEIDIGETNVNMARRVTLFFANGSNMPVQVEKVNANSDANVIAEIANDDCSKQGSIAANSRCTVELSITPTSPGTWSVEVLMTHNGAGRIARAKVSGKTSGTIASGDRKETGLDMSSKEVTPINFGELEVNGKAVRSALMVNDSPDPITILSIDVIEASNGLSLLEQGCSVDLELKPGETCPVTLVWAPAGGGQVSTDLIIRHSGRQGFTVIPVRGKTKGSVLDATTTGDKAGKAEGNKSADGKASSAPTLDAVQKAANLPQISSDALSPPRAAASSSSTSDSIRLIGTVGNKALLLLGDGSTRIVAAGDDVDLDNDQKVKVIDVTAKSVALLIDGKKKELKLGSAKELVSKASAAANKSEKSDKKSGSSSSAEKDSGSSSSSTSTLSTSPSSASSGANPNVKQ